MLYKHVIEFNERYDVKWHKLKAINHDIDISRLKTSL